MEPQVDVLDIRQGNFRMTDEEAIEKIQEICGVEARDLASMDTSKRYLYIKKICENGISIRQISRITGINKGIIERMR